MQFYLTDLPSFGAGNRLQGTDLVGEISRELFAGNIIEAAAAKSPAIIEAGMRPNRHIVLECQVCDLTHLQRVTSVKSARYIGARDNIEHGGVIAHAQRTKTFAKIRVKVN